MHQLTKCLKSFPICIAVLIGYYEAAAQSVVRSMNLEQAYQLARANYPLIRQKDLLNRSASLSIENIHTAYLPQVSLNGQAGYQSDVTSVSIPIPGFSMTPLSKDQYKLWADVNQLLYDGGQVKLQQEIQDRSARLDEQKLEVELYKLRGRINQIYLGILMLDAQMAQAALVIENAGIGLKIVQAQLAAGTVFKSSSWVLEAQVLQYEQRMTELRSNRVALIRVLGLFVHQSLSEDLKLDMPDPHWSNDTVITRPEIKLYAAQDSVLISQQLLLNARQRPRVSLFAQGGYGKPGLNMLNNDFAIFGIGGIRLNWSISNFYTHKREQQINSLNQKMNEVQKEVFLFNTDEQLRQQESEIRKYTDLVEMDKKLIALRRDITGSAKSQLENGVIHSNDYLREINAEDQVKVASILHQIQLLQAKINYLNIKGNQ